MRSPEEISEVSRQELESVCRKMKINEAPGIDGMIDTAGKLLERIICRRLDASLGEGGLPEHQFGFRKALSTIDDNSAGWKVTRRW